MSGLAILGNWVWSKVENAAIAAIEHDGAYIGTAARRPFDPDGLGGTYLHWFTIGERLHDGRFWTTEERMLVEIDVEIRKAIAKARRRVRA